MPLSPYLAGPGNAGTWRRRHQQVQADPGEAAWVTGVIWDEDGRELVHELAA